MTNEGGGATGGFTLRPDASERSRMLRARAMHDAVTGAPEVWDELPESHEDWAQTADEYVSILAALTSEDGGGAA